MGWRRRARAKLKGKRNPHARMLEHPAFRQKRIEGVDKDRKYERGDSSLGSHVQGWNKYDGEIQFDD